MLGAIRGKGRAGGNDIRDCGDEPARRGAGRGFRGDAGRWRARRRAQRPAQAVQPGRRPAHRHHVLRRGRHDGPSLGPADRALPDEGEPRVFRACAGLCGELHRHARQSEGVLPARIATRRNTSGCSPPCIRYVFHLAQFLRDSAEGESGAGERHRDPRTRHRADLARLPVPGRRLPAGRSLLLPERFRPEDRDGLCGADRRADRLWFRTVRS